MHDAYDVPGERQGAATGTVDGHCLLGHVGSVLGLLDHRLRLTVLVHRDRHHLLLQARGIRRDILYSSVNIFKNKIDIYLRRAGYT